MPADHDYADGGVLNRECRLALRLVVERVARHPLVEGYAAGVDKHNPAAEYLHLARDAVARDARLVEDDGDALLRYPVEKRALARVGAPD